MKDLHIRLPERLHDWLLGECRNRGLSMNVYVAKILEDRIAMDGVKQAAEATKGLTAAEFADALDCFWNAAIGESHRQQEGISTAAIMAEGIQAVANRLREIDNAKG